jgi:hypothetical protein
MPPLTWLLKGQEWILFMSGGFLGSVLAPSSCGGRSLLM